MEFSFSKCTFLKMTPMNTDTHRLKFIFFHFSPKPTSPKFQAITLELLVKKKKRKSSNCTGVRLLLGAAFFFTDLYIYPYESMTLS